MTFELGARAAQAGHRVRAYESLDSTNSEALRLARAGEGGPLWIVTREQTAGRGRRGRAWLSGAGNLATSFLFAVKIEAQTAATLGFVASLAVCQACRDLAPGIAFSVKWPNDVLADGRKLSGILLESEARGEAMAVVTGIGMNLSEAPEGMAFPAVSLARLGVTVTPERAFACVSDAYLAMLELWQSGRGFPNVRKLWLDHAKGVGQPVSIRIGERSVGGVFETLDEQGRLMLRKADGTLEAISAGEVHFGNAASAGTMA